MELNGEYEIAAPRERVWDALNDPDVLKACIPGCDSLEKTADNAFEAKVTAKVGPVKAKFGGSVTLENMNPPESYSIVGEGKGGAAGFAKGSADVHLAENGANATLLTYVVKANVGGKLAQLGTRLIQGTSKRMADDFFARFREQVEGAMPQPAPAEAPAPAAPPVEAPVGAPVEAPVGAPVEAPVAEAPPAATTAPPPPPPPPAPAPAPAQPEAAAAETGAEPAPAPAPAPAAKPTVIRERERERVEPPPPPKTMSPLVWIAGLIVLILLLIWFL